MSPTTKCLMAWGLLLVLLAIPRVSAQEPERLAAGQEGALAIPDCAAPGLLYVPSDYEPGKRMPLIVFLHGSGGKPTSWPWRTATAGKGYFIAGLPYGAQADLGAGGILSDDATSLGMAALIDRTRASLDATYGIAQDVVILSGLSMGGWGVNFYGFIEAARGRYAGYAIMAAGPMKQGNVDYSVAEGLPVLLLNGATDQNLASAITGKPQLEAAGARVEQVIIEGQGHVPAVETMAGPLRDWLGSVVDLAARRKGIVAVHWEPAVLTGDLPKTKKLEDLEAFLAVEPWVQKVPEGRPILIFGYSNHRGRGDRPTRAARGSAKAEDELFEFPAACEVPVATRYFSCFRFDLSDREKSASALFNEAAAPFVVLLNGARQVVRILDRSDLRTKPFLDQIQCQLDERERAAAAARSDLIRPLLEELAVLQRETDKAEAVLAKLRAARKPSTSKIEAKIEELRQLESRRQETLAGLRPKDH